MKKKTILALAFTAGCIYGAKTTWDERDNKFFEADTLFVLGGLGGTIVSVFSGAGISWRKEDEP